MNSKITLRLLASTGCYAMFRGSKALGTTNTSDAATAVEHARRRFPGTTIIVKNFFRSAR